MKQKRIGYVDYSLDNFHSEVYLKHFREELKKRGFEVAGAWALEEKPSRIWAKANDVPYYDTPQALNEAVDFFMVLAPGNTETHLKLCQSIFPFKKTTYVDKTFAPDLKTAKRIFALADKHKVKMQTTSALRYTNVQTFVCEAGRSNVRHMVAWGGGRSFGEYAIHPVELIVSCMGAKATRLMRRGTGKESQLLIDFSGNRTAVANVYIKAKTDFAATVTTKSETRHIEVDSSELFLDTASALLDLFESGKPNIPRAESLMVRRILDVAENPKALKGFIKL
ncbi:MAG: hypothetical protein HRT89_20255 [Lentisphaeria bacterium]|nr:hypothetical protein [Lentisphaeria bacterium]